MPILERGTILSPSIYMDRDVIKHFANDMIYYFGRLFNHVKIKVRKKKGDKKTENKHYFSIW